MDNRATSTTTLTRLSVIPILIALLFNLLVPVISATAPEVLPKALQPTVTEAVEPNHVSFTLEGCRDPSVDLELTGFVCADADYTTGNLGKTWNELDLVPHRLTTTLGEQDAATTTYDVAIVADFFDDPAPGYDVISVPVINEALSDDSCEIVAVSGGTVGDTVSPGLGGIDTSIYRIVTISQDKGTTCVLDYYQRLALGSHLFPGSSLHSNLANENLGTSGIGSKEVSIPVKEILPQELSKTMTAEVGQAYSWAIEKSADPTELNFANTCLDTEGARAQDVEITVTWTRSGPTASGATTIPTVVTATNPAHRTITVQATDKIYEGAGQTTLLDQVTGAAVDVPAESSAVVLTHTFEYNGTATTFNDVATATYTDKVTGIPVPGATQAVASATSQPSSDPIANSTVTITDTESITGTGLSFSVAAPSVGAFTGGYVAGTETTGPVGWEATATNSGSVTFTKTVMVDEPRITSGTLSDTANILGDGDVELDSASASVDITTDALVELTINKTIPSGSLRSGESVTFDFDVTGPGSFSDTASITFNFGDPLTKSVTLSGLEPGTYEVSEQPQPNWADHTPQETTITLPDCDGSVAFNNSTLAPDLDIDKSADDEVVNAGEDIGFSIVVSNDDEAGTGIAKDVTLNDPLPGSLALGVDWEIDAVLLNGSEILGQTLCEITGSPATETLECDFGDLDPGDSYEVQLSSGTDAPDGCETATLPNTATANASNHDEIEASATITVECPALSLSKEADDDLVSVGEDLGFTITVSNGGGDDVGTATNVTIDDPLPGNADLGVDWSVDTVWLNGVPVADPSAYCEITGSVPTQTLECSFGDLAPGDSAAVHVTSSTSDLGDCETANLPNVATADADNHAQITASDSIVVECPGLNILKTADDKDVVAGEEASFTILVWNAGPGTAFDVTLHDDLPEGLTWDFEVLQGDAECMIASSIVMGGVEQWSIDCDLGDLDPTDDPDADGVKIRVFAETDGEVCGLQENTATADASNDDEVSSTDDLTIRCPQLVIDKVADAEVITISGPAGDLVADPAIVTWTLTYTLTDGPVTNAVITDEVPVGFVFLDASDGGELIDGVVTWTFPTLTESGSVSFRTTVDPETIDRANPTVNTAVIDSDETEPDEGEDSVTVVVEPPVLANTPAPKPSVPNTAVAFGTNGEPVTVPVELLVAFFIGSLGAMALANVRARSRR